MWVPKQKCEYRTRDAQVKKSLLHAILCCGYSLEVSGQSSSNEDPQHIFVCGGIRKITTFPMGKKNNLSGAIDKQENLVRVFLIFAFSAAVTMKIRSRSPKLNQFFVMSKLCIYENLVRIQPLVYKILSRQECVTPTITPMGSAPNTVCPPPQRWEDIIIILSIHQILPYLTILWYCVRLELHYYAGLNINRAPDKAPFFKQNFTTKNVWGTHQNCGHWQTKEEHKNQNASSQRGSLQYPSKVSAWICCAHMGFS